ncbi:MAG: hypothetical protein K0S31_384 [Sphingobacterium multivorum]|jgi:hypothetical protein|nr:hypothetical protein [Sphingobacterium multivorum]
MISKIVIWKLVIYPTNGGTWICLTMESLRR